VFGLAKFVEKNVVDIADGFACLTYLDHHIPLTEMALFELRGPRKPRQVGVVVQWHHNITDILAN
jgi:hypothetical protein